MQPRTQILIFLCIPALAGCLDQPPLKSVPVTEPYETVIPILNDCAEWGTTAPVPGALIPHEYPAEWEEKGDQTVYRVILSHLRCSRANWGPYERGPISLIFESFDAHEVPSACHHPADAKATELLTGLWISDPKIAAYARTALDGPVYQLDSMTDTSPEESSPQSAFVKEWEWSFQGGTSRLTQPIHPLGVANDTYSLEFFWETTDGLARFFVNQQLETPMPQPYVAQGSFSKPFIFSNLGPEFVGTNDAWTYSEPSFQIDHFSDALCESPRS